MAAAAASERMHNHVLRRAKKQSGQGTALQSHRWIPHRSIMNTLNVSHMSRLLLDPHVPCHFPIAPYSCR